MSTTLRASEYEDLTSNEYWKNAHRAFNAHLPEVALEHFQQITKLPQKQEEQRLFYLFGGEASLKAARYAKDSQERTFLLTQAKAYFNEPVCQGEGRAAYGMAQVFLEEGEAEQALSILPSHQDLVQKRIDSDMEQASVALKLQILFDLGRFEESLALIKTLNHLGKDWPFLDLTQAQIYVQEGRQGEEIEALLFSSVKNQKEESEAAHWELLRGEYLISIQEQISAQLALRHFDMVLKAHHPLSVLGERACLGKGKALEQMGESQLFTRFLLQHIDQYPTSSLLEDFIERLEQSVEELLLQEEPEVEPLLRQWSDETQRLAYPKRYYYAQFLLGALYAKKSEDLNDSKKQRLNAQQNALGFYQVLMDQKWVEKNAPLLREQVRYRKSCILLAVDTLREEGIIQLKELIHSEGADKKIRALASHRLGELSWEKGEKKDAEAYFAQAFQWNPDEKSKYNELLSSLGRAERISTKDLEKEIKTLTQEKLKGNLLYESMIQGVRSSDPQAGSMIERFLEHAEQHASSEPLKAKEREYLREAKLLFCEWALSEKMLTDQNSHQEAIHRYMNELKQDSLSPSQELRYALMQLQGATFHQEYRHFISTKEMELSSEESLLLTLKTAEFYYLNGEYHKARALFVELAQQWTDPHGKRQALFFAAQSALKVGTRQSIQEGLLLLEQLIQEEPHNKEDVIKNRAQIMLARYYLSQGDPKRAQSYLKEPKETNQSLSESLGVLQIEQEFLLAEVYYARGSVEDAPEKYYQKALKRYRLLAQKTKLLPLVWQMRATYYQGLCLEALGQDQQALTLYDAIANQEAKSPYQQEDWEWYYRNGFHAIHLLEKRKRWKAAYKLAKTIAQHQDAEGNQGDRALEAQEKMRILNTFLSLHKNSLIKRRQEVFVLRHIK